MEQVAIQIFCAFCVISLKTSMSKLRATCISNHRSFRGLLLLAHFSNKTLRKLPFALSRFAFRTIPVPLTRTFNWLIDTLTDVNNCKLTNTSKLHLFGYNRKFLPMQQASRPQHSAFSHALHQKPCSRQSPSRLLPCSCSTQSTAAAEKYPKIGLIQTVFQCRLIAASPLSTSYLR